MRIRMAKIQMISVPPMIGVAREGQGQKGDQGNARHAVRFEAVRRRTDAVARVVTGAVGDDARVFRVIFRQMEDDLHQVGADVGDLGEDAAADPERAGAKRLTDGKADEARARQLLGEDQDADHEEQLDAHEEKTDAHAGAQRDIDHLNRSALREAKAVREFARC